MKGKRDAIQRFIILAKRLRSECEVALTTGWYEIPQSCSRAQLETLYKVFLLVEERLINQC